MMEDEEFILGISIFVLTLVGFFGTIIVSFIKESIKEKKSTKLREIKSTRGNELKEITKEEARYLIKECSENEKYDFDLLSKGTHYFIYRYSHEGWLDVSAKIPNNSLLITREFKLDEEIKKDTLNISSRILIFNEYGSNTKKKAYYVLRHIWGIGKLVKEKDLLTLIYDREDFKRFFERHEYQLKEPWRLSEDFIKYSDILKVICKEDSAAFVSIVRTTNLMDQSEKHKMTFKLYEAVDGYQVITTIPGLLG